MNKILDDKFFNLGLDDDLTIIMRCLADAWNHFIDVNDASYYEIQDFERNIHSLQYLLAKMQMPREHKEGWY